MCGREEDTWRCSKSSFFGRGPVSGSRHLGEEGGCGPCCVGMGSGLVGGDEFRKWAYLSPALVVVILLASPIVELYGAGLIGGGLVTRGGGGRGGGGEVESRGSETECSSTSLSLLPLASGLTTTAYNRSSTDT